MGREEAMVLPMVWPTVFVLVQLPTKIDFESIQVGDPPSIASLHSKAGLEVLIPIGCLVSRCVSKVPDLDQVC